MGVILAAGDGVRMEPFSRELPKPLLPVLGRPVVEHQLALLRTLGVEDVVIVVGRAGEAIEAALAERAPEGLRLRYVEQAAPRGIAHAVGVTEPLVDRPFVLLLGDIFLRTRAPERLRAMHAEGHAAVLAATEEDDPEKIRRNFAIVTGPDGAVRRVIEKPRHPPTRLKGCGLYLFDLPFFDAIRRTPRSALRDEFELTDAIQIFIDDGHRVGVADIVEDDVNLTHPRDLWERNLRELARAGWERWVDPTARVHPEATLRRAVVGPGARIGPVRVEDALVFGGAELREDAVRCVVTPGGRVTFEEDPT